MTLTTYTDDAAKLGQLSGVPNGTAAFASDFRYDGRRRLESYLTGAVTQSFAYDRQNRPTTARCRFRSIMPLVRWPCALRIGV